jgi:hypothetical protein
LQEHVVFRFDGGADQPLKQGNSQC